MAGSVTSRKLEKYRAKRDFSRTPEPSGDGRAAAAGNSFVIQKHAARRLHYDFRLELDGVLLSWSVPKGPSLSPKDRRLAVRTEDHPLDYGGFEGIIPEGYGAGTVAVWDRGTWEPEEDPRAMLERGRMTFALHGEKLHGTWHLVRTKPQGKQESWLLFKGRDDAADAKLDITATRPESVVSGRTIEAIGGAPERAWHSDRPATPTVLERRTARILHHHAAPTSDVNALVAQLPLGFELTSLDKVLFPEEHVTKGALIAYYAVVADWVLPHVAHRPLTLVRCPDGRHAHCFFQKALPAGAPPPLKPLPLVENNGDEATYMQVTDLAGLVACAQLGALELHTWGARADKLERPDLLVFDLDPDPALAWDRVAHAALELRRRLHDLDLDSWLKTTGGKGLHVVVPIERRLGWDDVKGFAHAVVAQMAHDDPAAYTINMAKRARPGKVFLDYLRNGRGATFVAPYSPRARHGAPVATPITWEELARGVEPAAFTITTIPERLGGLARDPWRDLVTAKQTITAAMRRKAA